METTAPLFTIANTAILLAWVPLWVFPKWSVTQQMIAFPYIPFVLSFFYLFFLIGDKGLVDADFSSLAGILELYRNATPEGAAAGWMHYLAFDYWIGCWILRDAQKKSYSTFINYSPVIVHIYVRPSGNYALCHFFSNTFRC